MRRNRLAAHQRDTDWIVVRNRISTLSSRNQRKVVESLKQLAALLGFRIADGISERVIFREFFPAGVTVLDTLDRNVLGVRPTMSHLSARREIRELVESLRLPLRPRASCFDDRLAPALAAE
jgi:chromosome partitioning protein